MSSTEEAHEPGQGFRIGEVFSLGFSILRKHLAVFGGLSVLFYAPSLILTIAGLSRMGHGHFGAALLSDIVASVLQFVLVAAVTYGTFRSLQGREVTFGGCLGRGLGRFLPVFGVSLAAGILIAIGLVLLVVPGLIVGTFLYVAVPAVVVERRGIFNSLNRSAELTKGHRWQVFGIMALLSLLNMAFGFLVQLIAPAYDFSEIAKGVAPHFSTLNIILTAIVGIVFYALNAIFPAVVYYKLRSLKEGLDVSEIAAVFD